MRAGGRAAQCSSLVACRSVPPNAQCRIGSVAASSMHWVAVHRAIASFFTMPVQVSHGSAALGRAQPPRWQALGACSSSAGAQHTLGSLLDSSPSHGLRAQLAHRVDGIG